MPCSVAKQAASRSIQRLAWRGFASGLDRCQRTASHGTRVQQHGAINIRIDHDRSDIGFTVRSQQVARDNPGLPIRCARPWPPYVTHRQHALLKQIAFGAVGFLGGVSWHGTSL
jgi:hypothetical protein